MAKAVGQAQAEAEADAAETIAEAEAQAEAVAQAATEAEAVSCWFVVSWLLLLDSCGADKAMKLAEIVKVSLLAHYCKI